MYEERAPNQCDIMVEPTNLDVKLKSKKPKATKRQCEENGPSKDKEAAIKETFDFLAFFGRFLGWECTYQWKTNPRHWMTTFDVIFMWYHLTYSQILHFVNGEYGRVFEVFALYGISVSCVLMFWCYLKNFKEIAAVHNFSAKIVRRAGQQMTDKIQNLVLLKAKVAKFLCFSAVVSTSVYMFHPIKSFINRDKQKMVSMLPIEITFTNQSTVSGYVIANGSMAVMGVYAVFIALFCVLHFVTTILNYSLQVDLIEADVKQLDAYWHNPRKSTVHYRHMFLRNICQKCQDKDNYMDEIKKIFDQLILFFFCSSYLSQVLCLFEVKVNNWIPGYGIAYGLFSEMLIYSYFGTKAAVINERLCYVLTQSNWYTYDMHSQKIFLNLLNSCMKAKNLWIGPLAPLSVVTGIQIIKSIYSYFTFLTEAA